MDFAEWQIIDTITPSNLESYLSENIQKNTKNKVNLTLLDSIKDFVNKNTKLTKQRVAEILLSMKNSWDMASFLYSKSLLEEHHKKLKTH